MAIPTAPTATTIVTEALKRVLNGATPSAAEITRATDYGLENVKREIMSVCRQWTPLITIAYDITSEGTSKYDNPQDLEEYLSVILMDGTHSGALSAVTSTSSVTLATDEDVSEDEAEGKELLITSGTGVDQSVQIGDYNTATKVCTMAEAYGTLCVAADGYLICDDFRELIKKPMYKRNQEQFFGKKEKPTHYFPVADADYGYIQLYPVPDDTYGLKKIYFADLRRIDLTATIYSTLLRRWAMVLEQGVYVWKLSEDDDRHAREYQKYQKMLADLRSRDSYDMDIDELQMTVSA